MTRRREGRANDDLQSAPLRGDRDVTGAAEQAIVLEAAFAAAVGDRQNVIGFPSRPRLAPAAPIRAGGSRRTLAAPHLLGALDVEPAALAEAAVALPDLLTNVAGAASQSPLVDALVSAERAAPRRGDDGAAPAANRLARLVPIGLAPAVAVDGAAADGAHAEYFGAGAPRP